MNKNERFSYLHSLYISGKISVTEYDEFFDLLNTHEFDSLLADSIQNDLGNPFDTSLADLPPHISQEIVRNIYSTEKNTSQIIQFDSKPKRVWRWAAAAAVLIIAISSYYIFSNGKSPLAIEIASTDDLLYQTRKNLTGKEASISMIDGSVITLKPNSEIRFTKKYNDSIREVHLEGDAFFSVTKNPEKPFLVYYNNIVTKVLGTSFRINTNKETGNPEVTVKTGRVQVSENLKSLNSNQIVNSVIVTPNQKAIYRTEKGIIETALVDTPEPIVKVTNTVNSSQAIEQFVYDQEKLSAIFKNLETVYGIEINIENTNLNNCLFTGDVSGHDLFTQLKIICLATNSTFEVNGTRIIIKGNSCN